jgi:hypothetical protein
MMLTSKASYLTSRDLVGTAEVRPASQMVDGLAVAQKRMLPPMEEHQDGPKQEEMSDDRMAVAHDRYDALDDTTPWKARTTPR